MKNGLGNRAIMAKNLKSYMELNEKSRYDLCRDLDIKYTTLADWLNGRTYPRIDKIEQLAAYFGIKKKDLVEDHYEESKEEAYMQALTDAVRSLDDSDRDTVLRVAQSLAQADKYKKVEYSAS